MKLAERLSSQPFSQYCSVKDSGFNNFTKNRRVGSTAMPSPTREINSRL